MGHIMLNVPCGDGVALDLFGQELDMAVVYHGFKAKEMPEWFGYSAADVPDGFWDKTEETLCVFGPEEDMTVVTHRFSEQEMPEWHGYDNTGLPEGRWSREEQQLYI